MKRIIDVDEKLVCEGFVRNFTEEERDILIRAIANSTPASTEGDLISRIALKDKCNELMKFNPTTDRIIDLIDNAPTKVRPQGEWEHDKLFGDCAYVCSFCHTIG